RRAAGARRGHLLQARHLAELALERGGNRRGHHVRARARVEGYDLDRGIVDFGQRRERKQPVGDRAGKQDRDHQERGRDRPQDEQPRRAHGPSLRRRLPSPFAGALSSSGAAAAARSEISTLAPSRKRLLSTTTGSPGARPLSIETISPSLTPRTTFRSSTVR